MAPNTLSEWTFDLIADLCAGGKPEGDRYDFKYNLAELHNATKVFCAFANSDGGFIIVGVKETRERTHFDPIGIEPDTELYGKVYAKVQAEPAIAVNEPIIIDVPGSTRVLYVFEIPRSQRRPHLPIEEGKRFFYKRKGSDCVQMTLEEIRYQMLAYEEKLEKLALLLLELNYICRTIEQQTMLTDGITGDIFTFDIIDRVTVEAYAFLKSDINTIGALNMVKRQLTQLNVSQQRVIAINGSLADVDRKRQVSDQYQNLLRTTAPGIYSYRDQIARSLNEKFGVVDPFWLNGGNAN